MNEIALSRHAAPTLALGERLLSDERLAQRVARGSERAFAVLCERHGGALHRYCRSIVRDEHDAEDALQSALMRAFAALRASERDVAVRPWLFRIVHNEAISLLRRKHAVPSPVDERVAASGSVAATVEMRERLAVLVSDIQTLAERQRAALVMRELSGLSIKEIADALATTPAAAKQALFEARCTLHELDEGRAMDCESVRQTISERDGRVLRGRKLRAHLRVCTGCRDFGALIDIRTADLRALVPPLPAAAMGGLLARLLAHGPAGAPTGGATAGAAASLGGQAAAVSLGAKALTGLVVGVVGLAAVETPHVVTRHPAHAAHAPLLVHDASRAATGGATARALSRPLGKRSGDDAVARPGDVTVGSGTARGVFEARGRNAGPPADRGGTARSHARAARPGYGSVGAARHGAAGRRSRPAHGGHARRAPSLDPPRHGAPRPSHPGKGDSAPPTEPPTPPAGQPPATGPQSGAGTGGSSKPRR